MGGGRIMTTTAHQAGIKLADQVWVATAILHRQHPDRHDFTASEIIAEVRRLFGQMRAGIPTHISRHCVAGKAPNPDAYRILHQTARGRYRLFRPGDGYHPDREGGKAIPKLDEMPMEFLGLLQWYEEEYSVQPFILTPDHPLIRHLGVGDSGLGDLSVNHDRYLAEDVYKESHPDQPA